MDDDNNGNVPPPGNGNGYLPSSYRIRRPSSSIISSTTSPMFQAPPNPNLHPPPSPLVVAHHSRQRQNIISNNHFGAGDIDDDVQPSNSRASRSASSNNYNNNRPQSPLGSPDSTFWGSGPSPSPASNNSYRAPLTPGGMCVVSSSTSDDIPQSPFSPEEIGGGNGNPNNLPGAPVPLPVPVSSDNSNFSQLNVRENRNNGVNVPQGGDLQARLERALTPVTPSSSPSSSSSNSKRNRHHHLNLSSHQQNVNQDLNLSAAASSFSASSSSFNISPLRNKIKKASSFERFSLAQAAINSNAGSATSSSVTNEQSISSLPPTTGHISMGTNSSSSSVTVAGPSRLSWDPSPPTSHSTASVAEPTPSTSSASLRSFSGSTEKFHIKIPSKKLAAKIASVFEQEQLNESLAAAAASGSSIISSGPSAVSLHQTQNQGLIVSHQSQHHQPPSTLAQILNQSPSNINVNSIMNEESIMNSSVNHENLMRELSDAPLNLTESSSTVAISNSQQQQLMPPRNPVISRSSLTLQSKKQKLLHRMQSAEFMSSMSPPPPPLPTQQIQQHQQSIPVQTIQQQSNAAPIVTIHQNLPIMQDTLQNCSTNNNHLVSQNGPHSPQQQLESYGYESLLRSRDDFGVQDTLQKIVVEDANSETPMLYDTDGYNYYYHNILNDEIFSGNQTSTSSSRPLLMMNQGNLQEVDQPHGQLEFVLGLSSSADEHTHDRGRDEDDLQLNNDGSSGSQHQFLDSNDALSAMKSQSQADSTLRNLLMMDPIRTSHPDDAWLALAAEYQNRINADVIGRSGRSNSTLVGGNIGSSVVTNNINNSSWINEWPRTSSWQPHPSVSVSIGGGVQDQDEVMDMSMMEQDKGSMSNQNKRLQIQLQSNNDHGMDEIDLASGLPMLSSMQMSMPMDLQQPMSMIQHGSSSKDSLPMDLQQHHRMEMEDEPVNLMAVNIEQELAHHHNSHHSHQVHQQLEGIKGQIQSQSHQQGSYTLQIQSHHSPSEIQSSMAEINNSSNSSSDNIDERRIIRIKKNKDNLNLISSLDEGLHSPNGQQQHANVIMDKPIQPKSFASLPSPLSLARVSGNGWAVFTNRDSKTIPPNTQLGPVEGPLKKAYADDIHNMNAVYPCLVMADASNILWQLDRTDDELCNWMKFVRLAHSIKDQNALIVENDGYLYFMTCKEIPPKTELQVGYSLEYAQKYGFPYLLPMAPGELVDPDRLVRINSINSSPSSPDIQHEVDIVQTRELKSVIVETYPCFECDQDFSLVEDLQAHLEKSHKEPDEVRKPKKKVIKKLQTQGHLFSNGCGPSSTDISSKDQSGQNQLMSADSSMGNVESSSSVGNEVRDSSDGVGSSYSGKAQDNSVSTGGGQPLAPAKVKCSMCYKSFATKERLERHMIVHSAEDTKPLKCQFCTKRFLTNSALAGHIKTHAEEGKCFECPMCDFSTQQLLQLKEHVQSHKNRDSLLFHCPQCPKRFAAYSMIRKHIRAFHGPRQFSCDQCTMSFPTSDKLKLHKLKHSDHREFLCAECGRQFKRKDKLREHTKRIHETKKRNIEINLAKDKNAKKFIPKVSPEEYEKFTFKCQDCMLGFKRRGMLVNHLAKRHPDKQMQQIPELNIPITRQTRNYFCLYCERFYKSSSKRKAHILKAHPGQPLPAQMRGKDAAPSENVTEVSATPTHTGTVVQTVTDDGDPRDGIMNVSCTSNIKSSNNGNSIGVPVVMSCSGNNLVSTTSVPNFSVTRKETVVGKIVATPHACPWCHRQYATRAKLLQHQRKSHIHLMPTDMQTPRTQKNNVTKIKLERSQSEAVASTVDLQTIMNSGTPSSIIQCSGDPSLIPDSSTSSGTSTTTTTIQTVATDGLPVNDGNMEIFLLTTTVSGNGDLVPSEIMMVPVQNLSNATGRGSINVNVIQTSHTQPIASSSSNIILASSNSNGNSNNNVISNISNSGVNVSVTHPILTQME